MLTAHNFNIGQPDNIGKLLVIIIYEYSFCIDFSFCKRIFGHFTTEIRQVSLLDVFLMPSLPTTATLSSLQCLYCERTFRDISTLRDHMRKKQHRRINSSNKSYDKYYMINYLVLE